MGFVVFFFLIFYLFVLVYTDINDSCVLILCPTLEVNELSDYQVYMKAT